MGQLKLDTHSASCIYLDKATWKLLRRVAEARTDRNGGRPSVSAVVESLIEASREALEREAGRVTGASLDLKEKVQSVAQEAEIVILREQVKGLAEDLQRRKEVEERFNHMLSVMRDLVEYGTETEKQAVKAAK